MNWTSAKDILPAKDSLNNKISIKVINQDGDSVYYSYGYNRWHDVNQETEGVYPVVNHWLHVSRPLPKTFNLAPADTSLGF